MRQSQAKLGSFICLTRRQQFRNKLSSALLEFANVFWSRVHVTIRLCLMEMINCGSLSFCCTLQLIVAFPAVVGNVC